MRLTYFQMIDRVVELSLDDKTIVAEATVPQESTIFEGHFPGYPLMPGVLLIETMAQASGWLLIGLMKFERMPFLAAVREAKMRTFVTPGQPLTISAKVDHEGSGYTMTDARIAIDGKAVCQAALTFRHVPFPNAELRGHMMTVAHDIGFPLQAVDHG